MNKVLKAVLSVLPLKMIAGFILAEIKEFVDKTDNKVDDAVYEAVEKLFNASDISMKGVKLPPELITFFKSFDFKEILKEFVSFLETKAEESPNEFDDYFVSIFKSIVQEFGLIK